MKLNGPNDGNLVVMNGNGRSLIEKKRKKPEKNRQNLAQPLTFVRAYTFETVHFRDSPLFSLWVAHFDPDSAAPKCDTGHF